MERFDAIVIGSGVGGGATAYALNSGGKKVALVENDLRGGTCPNRGCDPKKVLIASVEALDAVSHLNGLGVETHSSVNWPELMAFKRTFTDPFPQSFEQRAQESGITVIKGTARFKDARCIEVNGHLYEADVFVVATGQHPRILDIDGKEHLKTSNDFLDLNEMPSSITFIGAGYIAFELAAIAHAAGSNVTIVHHNDRPLKGFDESFVQDLVAEYTRKGIRFVFGEDIKSISKTDEGYLIKGTSYTSKTAYVVCATGRTPSIADLNLEAAGVSFSPRGIEVD
ncbi:MAG: NAD(P)/FAD-dependent oxidoreductase, partial [Raoultibacter sp.]